MKKTISTIMLVGVIIISGTQIASAQYVVEDPGAISKLIASYGTELQNTYNNYKSLIQKTVINVFLTQAKNQLVQKVTDSMHNWVAGGFENNPNFVVNTDLYFKNVGNSSVRESLTDISKSTNPNKNSILTSLIKKVKIGQAPIAAQTAPTLGNTIQKNICVEPKLTEIAKANSGINGLNEAQIHQQLWDNLCAIQPPDAETEKALEDAYKSNFMVGGFDALLDITSNSAYKQLKDSTSLALQKSADKVTQAKDEVNQGQGFISNKKCIEYVKDSDGNDTNICAKTEVQTPASTVGGIAAKAEYGNNVDNLINSQGADGLLTNLLNAVITGFTTGSIDLAKNRLATGINGSTLDTLDNTATGTPTMYQPSTNTSNTTSSTTLEVSGKDKTQILSGVNIQINGSKNEISKLRALYSTFSDYLQTYKDKIDSLQSCVSWLTTNYPNDLNVPITSSGWIFNQTTPGTISSKISIWTTHLSASSTPTYNKQLQTVNNDNNGLDNAETMLNNIVAKLQSTNDISTLVNYVNEYSNAISDTSNNIPMQGAFDAKNFDYEQMKTDDGKDINNSLIPMLNECIQAKSTVYNNCINNSININIPGHTQTCPAP